MRGSLRLVGTSRWTRAERSFERGHPRAARGHPRAARGHPRAARGHPRAARGHPRAARRHPRAARRYPRAARVHPRAARRHPRAARRHPRAARRHPRAAREDSMAEGGNLARHEGFFTRTWFAGGNLFRVIRQAKLPSCISFKDRGLLTQWPDKAYHSFKVV